MIFLFCTYFEVVRCEMCYLFSFSCWIVASQTQNHFSMLCKVVQRQPPAKMVRPKGNFTTKTLHFIGRFSRPYNLKNLVAFAEDAINLNTICQLTDAPVRPFSG